MNATSSGRFRAWSTAMLAVYWLAMFGGTHWPNFRLEQYPQNTDKVLHFSAYAGLSFLLAVRLSFKRDVGLRDGVKVLAVIVVYAILDEVTQIPVGRTCDPFDALADWTGGTIGLFLFAPCRRMLRRLAPA